MDRLDALQSTCTLCQLVDNGVSFWDNDMHLNSELSLNMVVSGKWTVFIEWLLEMGYRLLSSMSPLARNGVKILV